jgi:heptosyltransferase I
MTVLSKLNLPPKKLCIIRLSAIGDTCHTVPIVRAIQKAWPDTKLTWVIGKIEHELLSGLEGVEFIVLDKNRGFKGYFDVLSQVRHRNFDLVLHMHASMRANLVSLMIPSKVRLGFDRRRARDYQWYFCNEHISFIPRQHVMEGLFEFVKSLNINSKELVWNIPISPEDRAFALKYINESEPTLLISPCSGQRLRNFRNWEVEHYEKIVNYVSSQYGAKTILTGGSTKLEQKYGEHISNNCQGRIINLIGKTTLKQLLALLERTTVLLCPDSGPAHMATAVGTPVVGLYATSNKSRTGPYKSQHLVVDKYPEALKKELNATVSKVKWGKRIRNPRAMNLITVPDVIDKLSKAFREGGKQPLTNNK